MKKLTAVLLVLFIINGYVKAQNNMEPVKNDISLPSKWYMLSDTENKIFVQPFIKRWKPNDFTVRFTSSTNTFTRNIEKTAAISSPKKGNVAVKLYELENFGVVKTLNPEIVVGMKGQGTTEVKISIIGDSYTSGGWFKDALLAKGYCPNIKMIGLRKVSDYTDQFDEGRGGWTLARYFSIPTEDAKSYHGFMQPEGNYRYWGATGFWLKASGLKIGAISTSTFEPNYSCNRYDDCLDRFDETTGYLKKPIKGDIMYANDKSTFVIYNGSSWVNTTEESYKWSFQYGKYLDMWGNLWKNSKPEMLVVMLGLNDFRSTYPLNETSVKTWNERIGIMKNSYLEAVPNGKFVICTPCSSCGVLDNAAGHFTMMQNAAMWEVRKNIIDTFDNRENEGFYIVDTATAIDNEKGYKTNDSGLQTGNPHPYLSYSDMGVSLAAFIQFYRK